LHFLLFAVTPPPPPHQPSKASHHTAFRPVLQKTPSSPLSPHSPATTADRQPAAAEYPSLSNNQVSSHGSRKGVVHHRASSPLYQLPVQHRLQVAPIKRSSLYCTVGKQQQLSLLSHDLPRTNNIGGHQGRTTRGENRGQTNANTGEQKQRTKGTRRRKPE